MQVWNCCVYWKCFSVIVAFSASLLRGGISLLTFAAQPKLLNMEKKEIYDNMPTTIIIDGERRKADEALRLALQNAQCAYSALREIEDLGEIPEPHNCTSQWLDCITNKKKEAVNKADFLTKDQRVSFIEQWEKLARKASGYVGIIQSFISSIPYLQYGYDEETANIYIKDFTTLVNSRCVRSVPSEAHTHWQLIQNARKAIQDLRQWENGEDMKKYRLEELFAMTPQLIAEEWATSNNRIDHRYDHLPGMVEQRKLNTGSYL